jgi:predicted anti-sigma-YlaC factor YlaD
MTAEGCRQWREQLGAYSLGHLDPDERAAVRAHLDACAECRAEAESLAAVARVLPVADPARLGRTETAPSSVAEGVFARIDRERQAKRKGLRLRVGLALAGATVVIAALVIGAFVALDSDPSGPATEQVAFSELPRDIHIGAGLTPRPWGTQIDLYVRGVPSGTMCRVWLRRRDGARVVAGSFRYVEEARAYTVRLASALDRARATAIGVTAGRWTYVEKLPAAS